MAKKPEDLRRPYPGPIDDEPKDDGVRDYTKGQKVPFYKRLTTPAIIAITVVVAIALFALTGV